MPSAQMRLFSRTPRALTRTVVLGLDGTPFSLMNQLVEAGHMPNFAALLDVGTLVPMRSVLPTVSSVAWTSITTGCNPGKHNIFGFIDRVPLTHEMFIPTSRHILAPTWVDHFDRAGKRVFSMGVPATYPPKPINGVLIPGFLAPSLKNATHPLHLARELEAAGYVIDIDAWQAREDRDAFLDELFNAFDRRCQTLFRFLGQEPWDLFVAHIMDTDRLHHFLWADYEAGSERYAPWFLRFYERVDEMIGRLVDALTDEVALLILSDHGFCSLEKEVHLNHWLRQAGYLQLASSDPKGLRDLASSTRCYSLLPGRIYLKVRGREYEGSVAPGAEYERLRDEIAEGLASLRDDETGAPVIEQVYRREELFSGGAFEMSPDLIARPARGYDLKGGFDKEVLFEPSPVCGTHTYDDAMFYTRGSELSEKSMQVVDVLPTLFSLLGMDVPEGIDGRSVAA